MVSRGSANEFLFRKMVPFICFLWCSIGGIMFYFIRLVNRYVSRFHEEDANKKDDSNCSTFQPPEITMFDDLEPDEPEEKDTPKFCFKFQYQTLPDTRKGNEKSEGSFPTVSTSKYQFVLGKDFCGFMEEPEVVSFTVKELYANSYLGSFSNKENIEEEFLSETDPLRLYSEMTETIQIQEETVEDNSIDSHSETGETGKTEFLGEKGLFALDTETESTSLSDEFSLENLSLDPKAGFFSESDLEKASQTTTILDSTEEKVEMTAEIQSSQEIRLQNSIIDEPEVFHSEETQGSEEQTHLLNSRFVDIELLSERDMEEDDDEEEEAKDNDFGGGTQLVFLHHSSLQGKEGMDDGSGKTDEPNRQNTQKSLVPGPEEGNELEMEWEHQDLIEQLKMELKKVRATGLPTILEESESPRVMEDLKPWKIDEKFLQEDRMDELHKFYKSYSERMRKFDILNYQKMYAIGFLQLKDPLLSISNQKSSNPAITTILSQNFWLGKSRKAEVDPTMKFIGELQSDLEMVYVGQMCLSWEILHWQYGKAQELQESDIYGIHEYNQVASEFQQFQVLMQRFLENEAFQGPRVQNYVKSRCFLRNLLQVPVIKEDSLKDKRKARRDDDAFTIAMLTEIIEKSMQIMWEFVRADKDEATMILKGFWRTRVEFQNPADLELLTEIRTEIQKVGLKFSPYNVKNNPLQPPPLCPQSLTWILAYVLAISTVYQKKKKLKDILRSGNCIVRRFQKREEDISDLMLFLSQVDMKLISRVLNMSRITSEQLLWCHKKLHKINFVDRKIYREPSFLLFPC